MTTPPTSELRFYGPLNDFLPPTTRQRTLTRRVDGRPSVKDVIEAAGVPHPEVALATVDGVPVDLAHRLDPDTRVAVYPEMGALAIPRSQQCGPTPRAEETYVLDGHLGRLARLLRLVGIDTVYERDADDAELARMSGGPG